MSDYENFFSKLCLIGLSLLISGCISLLVPNVTTEVVNLRAGEYKLDQTHAAIIFKVQHICLLYTSPSPRDRG